MTVDASGVLPAVVLGREQTGLGTLRSLRLAGIPAFVACPRNDLVARSRWYRSTPGETPWDGSLGQPGLNALEHLPFDRCVLIPGRDDAALWAADLPSGPLAGRVLVSSSSRATLEVLQDKSRFGQFLAGTTIPHPRTFTIRSEADIGSIPFGELDRVFVKPADSQAFLRVTGVKGMWARNREEFNAIWRDLAEQGLAAIAQEYVPGGADEHYFIDGFRDSRGELTALFARRRVRISPPDFGSSSYCVSVPLGETASALPGLTELLDLLHYRGIFSAEFKRDARDGAFRILEVNTRAWWYVEFATRCGVNVVEMAWRDAQGLPVKAAPREYVVGAGCINLQNDLDVVFRHRGTSPTPVWRALGQWSRGHFNVFRWDDPLPGLQVVWQDARDALLRKLRRLSPGNRRPRRKPTVEAGPIAPPSQQEAD
ncbi:MAG: hypothetical protein J0H27_10365 [Xanthomonadales bacterium]|nr:hypothetical protein [Xanthomonadales bacterium]